MSVYDLTGRKALVTGGAQGLGAGMAEALARAGAAVVIGDIQEDGAKATAEALRESGAEADYVVFDVTRKPAALAALIPWIASRNTPSRSTQISWVFSRPSR